MPDREHPLELALRTLDLTAPVLTGEPTTKALDLAEDCPGLKDLAALSEEERLHRAIDEICRAVIALSTHISRQPGRLFEHYPGAADLLLAIAKCANIAVTTRNQLLGIVHKAQPCQIASTRLNWR